MTPCDAIRAGLDDWLDELADPHLRAEIDAHLAECDACAAFFKHQQDLAGDLLALSRAADRIAEAPFRLARPPRRFFRAPWRVAAAILIVAGAGLLGIRSWRHDGPTPVANGTGTQQREPPRIGSPDAAAEPAFRITVPDDRLAVRMESSNPRIKIVWFYSEIEQLDAPEGEGEDESSALPTGTRRL